MCDMTNFIWIYMAFVWLFFADFILKCSLLIWMWMKLHGTTYIICLQRINWNHLLAETLFQLREKVTLISCELFSMLLEEMSGHSYIRVVNVRPSHPLSKCTQKKRNQTQNFCGGCQKYLKWNNEAHCVQIHMAFLFNVIRIITQSKIMKSHKCDNELFICFFKWCERRFTFWKKNLLIQTVDVRQYFKIS